MDTTLISIFKEFDKVNRAAKASKIDEISVHKGQIGIHFTGSNLVFIEDIKNIEKIAKVESTDVSTFDGELYLSFREIEGDIKNPFGMFLKTLSDISDIVCTCPALEIMITDSYIKCYIDKPNVELKNLAKLDNVFQAEGVLELLHQRPYVLYVRPFKEDSNE